eukprot:7391514-Prymnesium_polylepis.3
MVDGDSESRALNSIFHATRRLRRHLSHHAAARAITRQPRPTRCNRNSTTVSARGTGFWKSMSEHARNDQCGESCTDGCSRQTQSEACAPHAAPATGRGASALKFYSSGCLWRVALS